MKKNGNKYRGYYTKNFIILFALIFIIEFITMIYIDDYIHNLPIAVTSILDSTLLTILIFPIAYILNLNPLERETIMRIQVEEKNRYNEDTQKIIAQLLHLSLQASSLKTQLELSMDLLLAVPWLALESTGSIYLTDSTKPNTLTRIVERNLPQELLKQCYTIEYGKCLCGLAALNKEIVFTDCINPQHVIKYSGMKPHGHYCVPIKIEEDVLGVLNLYVKEGHTQSKTEVRFLNSFANTLATIIYKHMKEQEIEYISNYDKLTGLPNRELLINRLNFSIYHANRYNRTLSLLHIDVDNFKKINDMVGYIEADNILKIIADRIVKCLRKTDTVARTGNNEFIVMIPELIDTKYTEVIAKKLLEYINKPYNFNNSVISIEASIGVSIYPEHGTNAETLLNKASVAMRHAKKDGGNLCILFSSDIAKDYDEQTYFERALMGAHKNNKLMLYYQPQIEINTGKIVGAEALLRWEHEGKLIPPSKFIPIAEQTGLIIQIGEWVIKEACKQNKEWQTQGLPPITIAVNISPEQLNRGYMLMNQLKNVLFDLDIAPQFLELELTESTCMQNIELVKNMLIDLNSFGVHIAIDDFGTGYSSLNYLKLLPFNKLKIDRAFIKNIEHDKYDQTIVEAIIKICHVMNLKIIAEGVETKGQLEILRCLKCNEVQGFLFSRPIPPHDFAELLKDEQPAVTYEKRPIQTTYNQVALNTP
ncbi:MAG: EAL domain-containing protein [Candidatus Magnetoovum sp. WYHC-5]|nr:EAL domain-containing protein [Candidatus Magnetoovum sp. WYHC-5]